MDTLVELENVTRRFGNVAAIEDLTLDLRAGEILGLYGASGSGKTTAIRLILGVHLPTSGTVRVLGVPSHEMTARQRRQVGYSPQRFLYPPTLSAAQVVWFAAGLYGIGWLRGRKAVRGVLEKVQLWEKRGRLVDQMSGGERRRVGNAAALVHSPCLVFLDEPRSATEVRPPFDEIFERLVKSLA